MVAVLVALAGSEDGDRYDCCSGVDGEPRNTVADAAGRAAPPRAFGKDADATAVVEQLLAQMQGGAIPRSVHRNLSGSPQDGAKEAPEHFLLDEDMHGAR